MTLSRCIWIVLLGCCCESGRWQTNDSIALLLEDVYGPAVPYRHALSSRTIDCNNEELDVLILQDTTESFSNDTTSLSIGQHIDKLVLEIESNHHNSSYGLITFRDKPFGTLGQTFDYCYRYDVPLSPRIDLLFSSAYASLWFAGGGDLAENQFGTLADVLKKKAPVAWNESRQRCIILITDSPPHFADDGLNTQYSLPLPNPSDVGSSYIDEQECVQEYYPDPYQIRRLIQFTNTTLIVLLSNNSSSITQKSWTWFNTFIDQPSEFVAILTPDGSNAPQVIATALHYQCPDNTLQNITTTGVVPPTDGSTTTPVVTDSITATKSLMTTGLPFTGNTTELTQYATTSAVLHPTNDSTTTPLATDSITTTKSLTTTGLPFTGNTTELTQYATTSAVLHPTNDSTTTPVVTDSITTTKSLTTTGLPFTGNTTELTQYATTSAVVQSTNDSTTTPVVTDSIIATKPSTPNSVLLSEPTTAPDTKSVTTAQTFADVSPTTSSVTMMIPQFK